MPVEVAERILREESYQTPEGGAGGGILLRLATTQGPHAAPAWFASIADADVSSIVSAIAGLGNPMVPSSYFDAYRDSARAMVEQKLPERMVAKMDAPEKDSSRLANVAIFVGVVGVIGTFLGVVLTIGG